jgi:PKD repeat protein
MQRKITFFFLLAFAMLGYQTTLAQTRGVTITGNCYLEGQTNHSGIKVLFTAVSPSAVTTEVFTAIDGAFVAGLAEGIYTVEYSKTGYWPFTFPGNISFFANSTLDDVTLIPGLIGIMEVFGPQSGIWESGYLVKAMANITVPVGDTLIIEPGVTIKFMGNFAFEIRGTLLAAGSIGDSIVFTSGQPVPTANDWQHIKFLYNTSSGSILAFTKVEYSNYGIDCVSGAAPMIANSRISNYSQSGISCSYSSPTIQNNTISNNSIGYGIYCYSSSPTIQNNTIQNNLRGILNQYSSPTIQNNIIKNSNYDGIVCQYSNSVINHNIIENNGNGITCYDNSPTIENNTIRNNNEIGIACNNSSPTIQNNNICHNGSGIYTEAGSSPAIYNNILMGNYRGVSLYSAPQSLNYNLFYENTTLSEGSAVPAAFGQVVTQNANGDLCDTYWNLFMNPLVLDYENEDYHLTSTSPCIDAGNPDSAYYDPDGTVADMGAFYYDQGSAAPVITDFTGTPLSGAAPLVVQFEQNVTGPVTAYNWFFGDGTTSNLPNPVHVFSQPGLYYVALEVTGPGGSNTKFKPNYIHVQTAVIPLNAAFTAAPLLGSAPLQVQFTNQSSGQWVNLLWDFGDGSTSTETNPLHTYQDAGSYNVLLTANSAGNQDTELKNNYIQVVALQEVVAIFTTTGTNGAAPFSVAFFDQSFGSVDSLLWNFGDGTTSTLANPTHVYLLPGEYVATLTAYGPLNTSTASETILVESVAPVITQITDRPNDQGGYVYVEFKKSFYDNVIPGKSTESYTIQREDNGHWVSLTSALAYGEAVYNVETATLADSVAGDNGLATYRVIAGMDEGTWISESAQGYSTDNLAPEAPLVLNYELGDEQLAFSWNQSQANDFDYFAIYKSNISGTFPGTPVLIQATTSYTETIAPDEAWFYSITAFDRAGNQSAYSEEVSTLRSMNLALPQGWSGISGYLNIYDPAIENVFEPLSGNLIILQNETGVFWPGQNINTLGNWQSSEGYQIKLAQPSGLTMKGTRLTNRSLQLAAGWNLIPVLAGQNTAIAGLFASTSLIMVKEVAGWRIYWPDYNISSLEVLEPGKAYFVLMASPATITFPAGATKSSLTNQSEMSGLTPWNLPTRTPSTHVVAFETTALAAFEPGDIVGAFTKNGWCAGLAQLETNTLALVAFGDDELTASADGFASAEMMNFSLFRPSTGETFGLQLNWNPGMNPGNFAGHGISVVSGVKLSPTAINETAASGISIFPNPTHGTFTIQGISNPAILKIFNAFGVEVSNPVIDPQGNIDLSAQPRGVYFIRIQNGEKVSFEKVVLN